MLHHHNDLLNTRDQVHRATHALDHLAGDHPICDVAPFRNFHRAQYGQVNMPAPDHREGLRAVEISALRQLADRLLACIDQIGIFLSLIRERPNTQHPIFRLERNGDILGHMIGDQGRNADAKIDVETVFKFLGGTRRHLVAGPAHDAASRCVTVRNSIFLS